MPFTPDQESAINFDKGDCLVAAGAGSGKTAVLSERVLALVKNKKCEVNELLILTFTNKAAFEMKERIRKKIGENITTRPSLKYIEQSDITTFDAFALGIVTKYYPLLNFKKAPSLIDESLLNVFSNVTLDNIIERRSKLAFEGNDELLSFYMETYFDKDFVKLKETVLSLLKEAELKEDKEEYISNLIKNTTSVEFVKNLEKQFYLMVRSYLNAANDGLSGYESGDLISIDSDYLNKFLCCSSLKELKSCLEANPKFATLTKKIEHEPQETLIRDKIVKANFNKAKPYFDCDFDSIYQTIQNQIPYMELVIEIASELNESIANYKRENLAYSFSDIASLARQIINIPSVNKVLKSKYKYIMVDEYQDTSDLQEALLLSLANNNLFAVGDIKQSIYKFRNANPKLFSSKMDKYRLGEDGILITLADNFRSREEILDGINNFFNPIMRIDAGGVDYRNKQALNFGNKKYEPSSNKYKYGLKAIVYDETKGIEEQANLIAKDIISKVNNYDVCDKGSGNTRKAKYSDFAILIDKKKQFDIFAKVFSSYHIPLKITFDKSIYDYDVIILLKNLLSLVYEIDKDPLDIDRLKHLYASISRSFLYEYNEEEIYNSIKNNTFFDSEPFKIAKKLSSLKSSLSLSEIIREIIFSFPLLEGLLKQDNIKANLEQIINFLSKAISSEKLNYSIKDYIDYFDSIDKYNNKITIGSPEVNGDLVSLMSIHASKGLEFHIVYLPCLGSKFKKSGGKPYFNKEVGFVFPIIPTFLRKKKNYLTDLASYYEDKEDISERMRLLYVAFTRAMESLILMIPSSKSNLVDKSLEIEPVEKYENFLSFISNSLCLNNSRLDISISENQIKATPAAIKQENIDIKLKTFIAPKPTLIPARPSKKDSYIKNYDSLLYGTKMHRYLEIVDFVSKDLSFIHNKYEREKIKNVLDLPIFLDAYKGKRYCEYSYIDPSDGKQGSIDMFIVYDDHIDLFDYKSNNIDDPSYDKQVLAYSSYLESAFNKRVDSYLLSISKCKLRKIEG